MELIKRFKSHLYLLLIIFLSCAGESTFIEGISITELDPELAEISGLTFNGSEFIAINDSGNGPFVYFLDSSDFTVKRKLEIPGVKNTDWEDLAWSDGKIYIGNFGNNFGNRRDLSLIAVNLPANDSSDLAVRQVDFAYSGQKSYLQKPYNHSWDCEALVVNGDSVLLFSKDWADRLCRLYLLEPDSENKVISPIDSLNFGFLITGSFYEDNTDRLYLCGYEEENTYVAILDDFIKKGFRGSLRIMMLDELRARQVESICVLDNYVYLGSERTKFREAIYKLPVPAK